MRICLVYDCLYPWTVGGAERWYRALAERLAGEGHRVTYLTRRQWDPAHPPRIPGVEVLAVSRAESLYGARGNRRVGPPLRFGAGVARHLLRRGRDYDVVHTASFPYFSLLAAAWARRRGRYRLVVDWFELWTRAYWSRYLGPLGGRIGHAVQRRCARLPQRAFCFSRLHLERLRSEGFEGEVSLLSGLLPAESAAAPPAAEAADRTSARSLRILALGRQIAEKRGVAVVAAIAALRARGVEAEGLLLGDGPDHAAIVAAIGARGLEHHLRAPGFVPREDVEMALVRAHCLLHPSQREGYGLAVVEAAAHGTPVVLVAGPDNAAVELVVEGVNGFVAGSADAADLADAVEAVARGGQDLRRSARRWFEENRERLSLESSLAVVVASYRAAGGPGR